MFLSFFYYFKVIVLDSEDRRVAGKHLLFLSLTLSGIIVVEKFLFSNQKNWAVELKCRWRCCKLLDLVALFGERCGSRD